MISEAEMKGLCHEPAGRRLISFLRKCIAWLFVVVGFIFLAGFFVVPAVAEKKLTELCGGAVYVESGRFNGFNSIKLRGLIIASDAESLSQAPILQADEVVVKFRLLHFFTSKNSLGTVQIRDYLLSADYQQETAQWTFEKLAFNSGGSPTGYLPQLQLQHGALRVRQLLSESTETVTTVGFDGTLEQKMNAGVYAFHLTADDRFDCSGTQLVGTIGLSTDSPAVQIKLDGRFDMGDKVIWDNCWNIDQIKLDCDVDRQELNINQFSFNMADGHYQLNGTLGLQASHSMNLQLNISNARLSDHFENNAIVYAEPVIDYLPSSWSRFLTDYNPVGLTNIDLHFKSQPEDPQHPDITGTIDCRDVSILAKSFPYQLEQLKGQLLFDGRNLKLDALKAKHNDVDVQVDAAFQGFGSDVEIDFHVQSPNLKLDSDVLAALSESNKEVWFAFLPSGTTAVDFQLNRSSDGTKTSKLQLDLKKAGAVYNQFPYPLENISGKVTVEPEQVQLNNLIADFEDGRKIYLDGQVFKIKDQKPNFRIHIQSQNIPVDEDLIGAMPIEQRQFFKHFDIDATADLDVDVFSNPDPTQPMDYIAKIKLDGRRLFYDGFPMVMQDLHLDVNVTEDIVYLNRFDCLTDGGRIMMDGMLMPKGRDEQKPGACLNLHLNEYDFNQTFWDAMGDYADRAFGKLRASGKMDVSGLLEINASNTFCKVTDLKVNCIETPITWAGEPCGVARGRLHIQGQDAYFDEFSLSHIQLENIPEDWRVGRIKTVYSEVNPDGQLAIAIQKGRVSVGQGKFQSLDIVAGVDLKDVSCGQSDIVRDMSGHVDTHLEIDGHKKTWRCLAKYDISNFIYRKWTVSHLKGQMTYAPEEKILKSSEFTADFYDGGIQGSFALDLSHDDNGSYDLQATYQNVDLQTFLMAGNEDQPPKVNQGTAEGLLNLKGMLSDLKQSQGKLVIDARDLKLGQQSLMGKVLTAIQFKRPENFVFTDVEFDAAIDGADLIAERIRIVGSPLIFYGNGSLNLDRRTIQASLVGMDKIVGDEGSLLNSLARGVGKALWKIEISGSLDDPNIDPVYLSVLKSPLQIFRKKESEIP